MKTKGKREEAESPWLGTMCGMLKGGALAFLTAVAILFLLLLTAGFLFYESADLRNGGLGLLLSCGCGGALAGVLGGNPKKKRRR